MNRKNFERIFYPKRGYDANYNKWISQGEYDLEVIADRVDFLMNRNKFRKLYNENSLRSISRILSLIYEVVNDTRNTHTNNILEIINTDLIDKMIHINYKTLDKLFQDYYDNKYTRANEYVTVKDLLEDLELGEEGLELRYSYEEEGLV